MKSIFFSLLFCAITTFGFAQTPTHQLSSHILDISTGQPAPGVKVNLEKLNEKTKAWTAVDSKTTDENGRIKDFLDYKKSEKGIYRLTFLTADYFKSKKTESFYPFIEVVFQIKDQNHYHVPITLSPFGYSTYRGN
ncbi:hydroxyisourate hydrolase [Rufibacter glacialis]|uniref:5-hydroxyisourate hydrolase n=1 Tax=Rufibacter glacialis TaxID=1259555 RepID=A0A5M8Q5P2_9BACT|nr:hydroxyisourate hydrolase [Rufibacter glacialis]KAA6431147.1 hydroxyisourate hydrolase [Rufibacter glacialis]GGK84463.1 5-hydroxyisourate hydrolase [Rufibacter glacialis]